MAWFDVLRSALQRTAKSITSATPTDLGMPSRTAGPPTSSNGASSMHLRWSFDGTPLGGTPHQRFREVSVVFTVVEPPAVGSLYFWALQASFGSNGKTLGAAHMGLQHHPRYPASGAVNWGGYRHGGGELEGSPSLLPSALNNANTRNFPWRPGAPYRYHIGQSPERGWRASVTDLERGETTIIRDLWAPVATDELSEIVVWSEVFADCDAPSVRVEWSRPMAVTRDGRAVAPVAMITSFQRHEDGGCANTTAAVTNDGIAQITNAERTIAPGTRIPLR